MPRPIVETRTGESRPLALACVEGSIIRAERAAARLHELIASTTVTEGDATWATRRLQWVERALASGVERRRALREDALPGAG